MKKRILSGALALSLCLSMTACSSGPAAESKAPESEAPVDSLAPASTETPVNLTATQKIIAEAETMTLEELAKKAIEESNDKTFHAVGNSSRGPTAMTKFTEYLQTIDPSYTMEQDWQTPKNNKIFDQLTADSLKETGTFAMTLIQDGNQIESKMVQTGILDTFVPLEWAQANHTTAAEHTGYLPMQSGSKVFMYNNTGSKTYDNCWDFVAEGEHGLFMDIDSEVVGKNFLYMLMNLITSCTAIINNTFLKQRISHGQSLSSEFRRNNTIFPVEVYVRKIDSGYTLILISAENSLIIYCDKSLKFRPEFTDFFRQTFQNRNSCSTANRKNDNIAKSCTVFSVEICYITQTVN